MCDRQNDNHQTGSVTSESGDQNTNLKVSTLSLTADIQNYFHFMFFVLCSVIQLCTVNQQNAFFKLMI